MCVKILKLSTAGSLGRRQCYGRGGGVPSGDQLQRVCTPTIKSPPSVRRTSDGRVAKKYF